MGVRRGGGGGGGGGGSTGSNDLPLPKAYLYLLKV